MSIESICANCGKEDENVNNICNKCKQVKYCNAACKKKHRHKHKKECDEHVRQVAEIHDKELFKQPPPADDCPICFIRLPSLQNGRTYMQCCGKEICTGCLYAPVYDDRGNKVAEKTCPFCRTPHLTIDEAVEREKKRMEVNDAIAIQMIGYYYRDGVYGYPQDFIKALELFHRAAELGCSRAYNSIGYVYEVGSRGVEIDEKKALYYYELAAMRGNEYARYNLGNSEKRLGNMNRALKHYMIAAASGHSDSLEMIKSLYSDGSATKDDYTKALRSYQEYLGEIKSKQRDDAAADNRHRYYE